jgi:hypothetical protein
MSTVLSSEALLGPFPNFRDRQMVLAAIPDKAALAASWGLRFADRPPSESGWVAVYDFARDDDEHGSARFHPLMGRFWREGERTTCLFDLGVALGHYPDWRACCADLASIYLPPRSS